MPTTHVRPVATVIAQELENAYLDALEFVADLHDVPPHEIRDIEELRHAVATEALVTVAHRAPIAEVLADRIAPRECAREGCHNIGSKEIKHPHDPRTFCSVPCKQWQRRNEIRQRRKKERELVAA